MKRNFLLFLTVLVGLVLVVNSTKRILSFKTTSREVEEAEKRLEALKKENEELERELAYKQSDKFAEEEIRNKLGLVREGEALLILPKSEDDNKQKENQRDVPNWQKWRDMFFGT